MKEGLRPVPSERKDNVLATFKDDRIRVPVLNTWELLPSALGLGSPLGAEQRCGGNCSAHNRNLKQNITASKNCRGNLFAQVRFWHWLHIWIPSKVCEIINVIWASMSSGITASALHIINSYHMISKLHRTSKADDQNLQFEATTWGQDSPFSRAGRMEGRLWRRAPFWFFNFFEKHWKYCLFFKKQMHSSLLIPRGVYELVYPSCLRRKIVFAVSTMGYLGFELM